MMENLLEELRKFNKTQKFSRKGPLCVALVITQHARKRGLPLDQEQLLTEGGGQVLGLGKGAVQAVLNKHQISRVLASEGGRTSRGSISNMRQYVAFLNERASIDDLDVIESFWIERVHEFFSAKPFKIRLDASRSLRTLVRDMLLQAEERQRNNPGMQYAGAVLQHLVGAKLDCALGPDINFSHHSFSTSDAQSGRVGDFFIGDVAIHVTTAPGEAVIARCRDNIDDGHRPIIVTTARGVAASEVLAENAGLGERIDIFEVEQFVALNLYELGKFAAEGRRIAVGEVVTRYNEIIDEVETDPSLKIDFSQ
ncbi:hypothetical protein A264_03545 [Pseudomonas syringae pv. actinidiae ICMP 19071]|uniref:DUF4928 family protein n=1 Tax=Pseudomonas syringae TaxID=317 RepID=UPI0003578FB4|nr:DUF4928 family protein [Pseudomonas syringae]EPM62329.1 hypothetical protein A264_03545 [Pseudomonas syringae pv. actinidiae ICMP 19071]EPM80135.1 hypothetical protein A3SO_03464 [Pseudomonas syringae pv. actinidiae ICMP 19072]RMS05261.1 hypothetical protein ALP75_202813 [Pseudomonas syringae pv. actinidiae]